MEKSTFSNIQQEGTVFQKYRKNFHMKENKFWMVLSFNTKMYKNMYFLPVWINVTSSKLLHVKKMTQRKVI